MASQETFVLTIESIATTLDLCVIIVECNFTGDNRRNDTRQMVDLIIIIHNHIKNLVLPPFPLHIQEQLC